MGRLTTGLNPEGKATRSFIGGMCLGGVFRGTNATWPLARLDLFSNGFRIRPSTWLLRPLLPVWEARFDELSGIELVEGFAGQGLRFRIREDSNWVVFWSLSPAKVVAALSEQGVLVDPDVKRFTFFRTNR